MTSIPLNYFSMPINYLRGEEDSRSHVRYGCSECNDVEWIAFSGLINQLWYRHDKVAIIILGGGLTEQGKIYEHVELRVRRAYSLYKKIKMGLPV